MEITKNNRLALKILNKGYQFFIGNDYSDTDSMAVAVHLHK